MPAYLDDHRWVENHHLLNTVYIAMRFGPEVGPGKIEIESAWDKYDPGPYRRHRYIDIQFSGHGNIAKIDMLAHR